jgi:putative FmdB family regulatory protein
MPTYDYECSSCEHKVLDIRQSFNDEPLTECPECGKLKLFRVVTGGLMTKVNNIDTVGKLADKNSKKYKSQIDEAAAKHKEENPSPEAPWYHNQKFGGATPKEINKMSKQQQFKYIMEGRK